MGHVLARLAGHGVVLVPHWPYRFARHPGGSDAVEVVRWRPDASHKVVIRPGRGDDGGEVVDIDDGPGHAHWLIETSGFRMRWPDGVTLESPRDPADSTPFYLFGPGETTIYVQGPVAAERVAGPDALVAPGQTVIERNDAVELSYEHDGRTWWQGHWVVPFDGERVLVLTAQALSPHRAQARAAAREAAATIEAT